MEVGKTFSDVTWLYRCKMHAIIIVATGKLL